MSKVAWILIAVSGLVAGCGGSPPPGSAAARSGSLGDQCAVCQMENPGYANSGLSSPCTQVCVASGQAVSYVPPSPAYAPPPAPLGYNPNFPGYVPPPGYPGSMQP